MTHWTASVDDFSYFVQSDFMAQVALRLEDKQTPKKDYATRLGVTAGRVSQMLNNPKNLTVRNIVKYARTLGMKVAIVTYDDGDPEDNNGPLHGEIFRACWQRAGYPRDVFALEGASRTAVFQLVQLRLLSQRASRQHWSSSESFLSSRTIGASSGQPLPPRSEPMGQERTYATA